MCFVGVTTRHRRSAFHQEHLLAADAQARHAGFTGYLDSMLMAIFMLGVVLVVIDAARRVWRTFHGEKIPEEAFGPPLTEEGEVKMGCC